MWFELEQHVMENGVKNKIADISVFSGPILDKNDKVFKKKYKGKDIQIPIEFWKVIVWKKTNGKLYAVGFIMSQWEWIKNAVIIPRVVRAVKPVLPDDYFETIKFSDHKTYQVPIKQIEKLTGIKFNWRNVSFPYKKDKPQSITAQPLKNIYPTRVVREFKQVDNKVKAGIMRGIKKELSKTKVSKTRLFQIVQSGQAPLVKRFELKNVTL